MNDRINCKYDYELAEQTKYVNIISEKEASRMGGELLSGNAKYVDPLEFMSEEEYIEMCAKVLRY